MKKSVVAGRRALRSVEGKDDDCCACRGRPRRVLQVYKVCGSTTGLAGLEALLDQLGEQQLDMVALDFDDAVF